MADINPDSHEHDPIDPEPSEAEVVAIVNALAAKVAKELASSSVETALLKALLEDQTGGVELLRATFESGRQDAIASIAARAAGGEPAPDWSDVDSMGERAAIAREDGICGRCAHAKVCTVAKAAPSELLLVVQRCAAFQQE